jgi:hypothetical protein
MKRLSTASNGLNVFVGVLSLACTAAFADAPSPAPIEIHKTTSPITVNGELSDEGWKDATRVDTWYETNPGDNLTPTRVVNVGYLAYDDKFLYAAFEFKDPEPGRIRAPFADRDNVGSDTDYGGIIVDTRNDGKTGILMLANPHGIQYDSVSDDVTGNEDSSPDFFWDSAAKITSDGWVLEIRVPFTSLRYPKGDPRTWGIMLYRNYPRDFRYQMFSTTLPRGGQCFICRSNKLTGLVGLPSAGHLVVAPYVSGAKESRVADAGVLGDELEGQPFDANFGFDLKWTPGANTAVDGTFKPDFSQIESDVAQIGSNERFALFFPEKRPFFLEGIELFSTPIQAVYTRTITSPKWGGRTTGKLGSAAYTALVAEDRGGGSVILPGPLGSDFADQDFKSLVAIARVRRDIGQSFVSALMTDREIDGGGHNRVFGPDFQWRPNEKETLTGQLLFSNSVTPRRPDAAAEWDGRSLSGRAVSGWWSHSTKRIDLFTFFTHIDDDFRADDGFVPQVGYRTINGEYGYTFRPSGFFRRFRPFVNFESAKDIGDGTLVRQKSFGFGTDARYNTSARFRFAFDNVRSGDVLLPRRQLLYSISANPSRLVSGIQLNGKIGEEVDFANNRTGTGADVTLQFTVRPTDHLGLAFRIARRWLDVDAAGRRGARLFTAHVDRLRATYTFTARSFLRVVAQYVETKRDPTLYQSTVARRDSSFSTSALLAYKLNWQTVLFLGYGDDRELSDTERLVPSSRQVFLKLSYAFQR